MRNGLYIDKNGTKRWYKNNLFHRKNGPAIEYNDGSTRWYIHGLLHREDGPAVIYTSVKYASKKIYWFINGKELAVDEEISEWIEENNVDLTNEIGKMAFKLRWM